MNAYYLTETGGLSRFRKRTAMIPGKLQASQKEDFCWRESSLNSCSGKKPRVPLELQKIRPWGTGPSNATGKSLLITGGGVPSAAFSTNLEFFHSSPLILPTCHA